MEIIHDPERKTFSMIINGYTGYVSYQIRNGKLDILHTVVPFQIGGQGVASQLVKAAYDYAINNRLMAGMDICLKRIMLRN